MEKQAAADGRQLFRTEGCTTCHNVDQSKPVPSFIVAMNRIFPGDKPMVLVERTPPLTPVQDTPGSFFDDKMAVVNASLRGERRGVALPLLLDLAPCLAPRQLGPQSRQFARSVARRDGAPSICVSDSKKRASVVEFLRGRSDGT